MRVPEITITLKSDKYPEFRSGFYITSGELNSDVESVLSLRMKLEDKSKP